MVLNSIGFLSDEHLEGGHRWVQVWEEKLRIGVDSGGTFTDIVIDSARGVSLLKVPSTPDEPERAILEALDGLEPEEVVHGSTVATNALLERKLARAAFVTNEGFADLLDIGRQSRPAIYDLHPCPPPALIPRADRFEIRGRLSAGGLPHADLDEEQLERLCDQIVSEGFEAVAIGLLHSTENEIHEKRAQEILSRAGVPVIISREVAAEPREWERFTTTCASAVLSPVMDRYLRRLARGVEFALLWVMDSSGAAIPWQRLSDRAVRTILSGPAGGAVAAAARCGSGQAIAFDMGGTSTDVCLVTRDQQLSRSRNSLVGGVPLSVPLLDVHTVGAGGGSQAWVDAGGALRVGPRSAGADPGPAAYRRGGTEATVTDAHVVLGRLPADLQLGGSLPLDREASCKAVKRLADRLGLSMVAAALGIIEVVDAEMERALRRVSQERGVDPRGMTLVCFGGAGGLHAVSLARSCGFREIRLPAAAGVLSAMGMLEAPWSEELEQVLLQRLDPRCEDQFQSVEQQLEQQVRAMIVGAGGAEDAIQMQTTMRARHVGQAHDLEFVPGENPEQQFRDLYQQRYGYQMLDRAVEAVAIRQTATLPSRSVSQVPEEPGGPVGTASVTLGLSTGERIVPRIFHGSLDDQESLDGPALVISSTTTLWLPDGARARVEPDRTLVIDPGAP